MAGEIGDDAAAARQARLGAALRANLRRRKAQARERADTGRAPPAAEPDERQADEQRADGSVPDAGKGR